MIRHAVTTILGGTPAWRILRNRALQHRPVTILCYHTLGPDQGGIDGWTVLRRSDFQAQLADLKAHYDIVSLDEAIAPNRATDRPQAVITFDDGDKGLYSHLLPILRQIPVPVTIYVATQQFETGRPFWFDRVVNALQGAQSIQIEGFGRWQLPATPGKARWQILGSVLQALKETPPDLREDLADQIAAQSSTPASPGLGPMHRDQLAELASMPNVTIGAHSHGHELLDQIPLDAARASIQKSQQLLADWTGQDIRHFAYPNGNHNAALREVLSSLGFATATILEERLAPAGCDPLVLPRISVGRYDSQNRVRLRLAGI